MLEANNALWNSRSGVGSRATNYRLCWKRNVEFTDAREAEECVKKPKAASSNTYIDPSYLQRDDTPCETGQMPQQHGKEFDSAGATVSLVNETLGEVDSGFF